MFEQFKMHDLCFVSSLPFVSRVPSKTPASESLLRSLSKPICRNPLRSKALFNMSTTPIVIDDELNSPPSAEFERQEQVLRANLTSRRQIRRTGLSISAAIAFTGGALSTTVYDWPAAMFSTFPTWLPEPLFALFLAASAFYRLELGRDGVAYFSRRAPWRRHFPVDINKLIEVRAAPGKGKGAFALQSIAKGTFLGRYQGEILDNAAFLTRYPVGKRYGEYVMKIDSQYVCDGRPSMYDEGTSFNLARMNHSGLRRNINVIRIWRRRDQKVLFYTNREIYAGEELCFDYDRAYWRSREHLELP